MFRWSGYRSGQSSTIGSDAGSKTPWQEELVRDRGVNLGRDLEAAP